MLRKNKKTEKPETFKFRTPTEFLIPVLLELKECARYMSRRSSISEDGCYYVGQMYANEKFKEMPEALDEILSLICDHKPKNLTPSQYHCDECKQTVSAEEVKQ